MKWVFLNLFLSAFILFGTLKANCMDLSFSVSLTLKLSGPSWLLCSRPLRSLSSPKIMPFLLSVDLIGLPVFSLTMVFPDCFCLRLRLVPWLTSSACVR